MIYSSRSLILIVLLLAIFQLQAQQNENRMINKDGDTIYIQAVPKLDINVKLEESNTKLKVSSSALVTNPDIKSLDSLLPAASLYIAKHKEIIYQNKELNIRGIDDYIREWLGYEKQLTKWQTLTTELIADIDKNLFGVKVTINTWEATKQISKETELPEELVDKIKEVIKYSKDIETKLKNKQDSLYVKQNILIEYKITIDEVLDYLNKNKESLQSDYFIRDSYYLWSTKDSTIIIKNARLQISKAVNQNIRSTKLFFETYSNVAYIHLIFTILILLLFYWANKEFRKTEQEPSDKIMQDTSYFLSHYLASGLIIALVASIFFYSNIPAAVREFVQLLLLIPAIFLIQGIYDKKFYPLIYTLVFLFIIDEIQVLLDSKSLIARILLIVSNIIILWILIQIHQKKNSIKDIFSLRWSRFIFRLANVLFIVTIFSIIFNLLGYVNLSLVLTNTTISLLLTSVVLIILLKVMLSLFIGLFSTRQFQVLNIVKNSSKVLIHKTKTVLIYFAIYLWIRTLLISLGLKDQIESWLVGLMDVEWKVGSGDISLGGIIGFSIAVILTVYLTKFIRYVLEDEIFPRVRLPRGVPGAISMLVRYVIVAFGIFVALSAAGLDLSKFGLIAGALGVGIGFGLQGVVYNFIAGLILAFERPIQKGDTIEIGTLMGDVLNIGVRASTIRTYDGSDVFVPNGNLISNELINWTLADRRKRREVKVGVAYGTDPREVMELLKKVAGSHPDVLPNPKPWPLFVGFGDSSLQFRVLFWASFDSGMTIASEVAMMIYDALIEKGIQIPFPQTDLHVKSFDPTVQKTIMPFVSDQKKEANVSDKKNIAGDAEL